VETTTASLDRKTASLIGLCTRVGGAVGPALEGPLERYGRALGRAFQMPTTCSTATRRGDRRKSVGQT